MSPRPFLVLYDGECGFCDKSVQWLLDHDRQGRLDFAALQGQTAERLRADHPWLPTDLDTMIFVEGQGPQAQVFVRSRAVLRICRRLGAPWAWLAPLAWLPAWLTDPAYSLLARHRYKVGGRLASCRLPAPEQRARFLP